MGQTPFDIDGDDLELESISTDAARHAEKQFVDYLREEAGHDIDVTGEPPIDAVGTVLHRLRNDGFDTRPDDGDAQVSVFVGTEFYEDLRDEASAVLRGTEMGDLTTTRVRGADVYVDGILDAGELLAVHHDAIVPAPVSTDVRPYLVRAQKGVAVAEVAVDE